MNEHQPDRRDEPAEEAIEASAAATVPATATIVREEPAGDAIESTPAADAPVEAAHETPPRRVVTINRSLFLALVAFGALAIVALGATTAWLALDRGGTRDPVVATVNGEPIRRSEYDRAVAASNGEEVLDGLVVERLIATEARKRNITVDDAETARQLDETKQQFPDDEAFQAALARNGLTEADYNRQLRLRDMLRQMVADKAVVTDQEVNDTYQASASNYAGVPEAQAKELIRDGLKQQRENAAARELLTQLRAESQIETKLPGKS